MLPLYNLLYPGRALEYVEQVCGWCYNVQCVPASVSSCRLSLLQVIFRKIADVKREQERQGDVALSIPEDHPVRKLFQKFRQHRDAHTAGESNTYLDHNCVQVELQHRQQHTDSNSYTQSSQPVSPEQQQEYSLTEGGSGCNMPEKSEQSCTQEGEESLSKPCAESQNSGAGGQGAAGGSRAVRGWAKFRNATSAESPCPAAEQQKQTQKADDWPKALQSSEQFAAPQKNQESGEGGERGSTEGGNGAGEETSALHKTDSCDSGITKSDLRIDRAGDSRSSFERSPLEKSPMEKNPFEHSLGVYAEVSLRHSFVQPLSEQALLQATLHAAKLELKGDIQILSGRLSLLEAQVSEILRLLSVKRRLSLPPASSPKARRKSQDSVTASRPTSPKTDDGAL